MALAHEMQFFGEQMEVNKATSFSSFLFPTNIARLS